MDSCIFCKIIKKEIPAKIVYEDDFCLGFEDLHPQAPTHLLFIPKIHISSLDDADDSNYDFLGKTLLAISKFAKANGFQNDGYRVVNNMGSNGGQTVYHIHFHFLAGKQMGWPPFPKGIHIV